MHLKLFAISGAESSTLRFCRSVFFHITILFEYRLCGWTTIPTTGHWAYIYCRFNYHYIPRTRIPIILLWHFFAYNPKNDCYKHKRTYPQVNAFLNNFNLTTNLLIYDWLYNVVLLHDSWALLKLIPYINDNSTTTTCIISLYIKENVG